MSYSPQELVARRIVARDTGRAQPLAEALGIGADPELTIAIVPIKIVTEEQVQAIGYGPVDQPPDIISRFDPLSRDVSDLQPFAEWLVGVARQVEDGSDVRLWVPHEAAVECLDVLGHRYATNEDAPTIVQDMGRVCRALAAELLIEDQPAVACALELLGEHFVTGQSDAEDRHLGSFLTWIDPPGGVDVFEAARRAALLPASGILPNIPGRMHDSEVEGLRRETKRLRPAARGAVHARMRTILEAAVEHEWSLMVAARAHLLSLPGTHPVPRDALDQSLERLRYRIGGGAFRTVQPHAVAIELGKHERGRTSAERRVWRADPLRRAAAVRRGRLVDGVLQAIVPAAGRGTHPRLTVATVQALVRPRVGDRLHLLDALTNFVGRVVAITVGARPNERLIELDLETGVRSVHLLTSGQSTMWEPAEVDLSFREAKMAGQIRDRAPWPIRGATAPAHNPSHLPANDLVAMANALKRTP